MNSPFPWILKKTFPISMKAEFPNQWSTNREWGNTALLGSSKGGWWLSGRILILIPWFISLRDCQQNGANHDMCFFFFFLGGVYPQIHIQTTNPTKQSDTVWIRKDSTLDRNQRAWKPLLPQISTWCKDLGIGKSVGRIFGPREMVVGFLTFDMEVFQLFQTYKSYKWGFHQWSYP